LDEVPMLDVLTAASTASEVPILIDYHAIDKAEIHADLLTSGLRLPLTVVLPSHRSQMARAVSLRPSVRPASVSSGSDPRPDSRTSGLRCGRR
jgi:hypothetical protein